MARYGCSGCYNMCDALCVCLGGDIIETNIFGRLIVETSDPRAFYTLHKSLRKAMPVVEKLVALTKAYDLPQLVSTHSAMNRRIARLKKLLRILDNIDLEVDTFGSKCFLSYKQLARPAVEFLEDAIAVMDYFKDSYHRERDPVHSYLYPIIHSVLDILAEGPVLVLRPLDTVIPRVEYIAKPKDGIEFELETHNLMTSKTITDAEFEKLLERTRDLFEARRELETIADKRITRATRRRRIKTISWIPWRTLLRCKQ